MTARMKKNLELLLCAILLLGGTVACGWGFWEACDYGRTCAISSVGGT